MSRILCLDYGDVRIGVAVSDSTQTIASPLPFIKNDYNTINNLIKTINEKEITKLIVGLPLNMKGKYSEKTIEVRNFTEELKDIINIPIILWDERLTTVSAEKILRTANIKAKKQRNIIDSLAAQLILQNYLDNMKFK